jgi:hypothetical protein
MADIIPPASPPGIIVQVPKAPAELTWVEQAHGVESVMTIIALVAGAGWAVFGDWRKTHAEREKDRELLGREQAQRDQQLRWDQAKLAKDINDQFLADHDAQQALAMVDADGDTCELTDEDDPTIKYVYDRTKNEQVTVLRVDIKMTDKKSVFLRDCFDAWYYWMSIMEQYLKNKLILQEDIAYPSDYYLRELKKETALNEACIAYVAYYKLSSNIEAFKQRFADKPARLATPAGPAPAAPGA